MPDFRIAHARQIQFNVLAKRRTTCRTRNAGPDGRQNVYGKTAGAIEKDLISFPLG